MIDRNHRAAFAAFRDRGARWAVALVCTLVAVWLAVETGREKSLERANAAGLRGDYRTAIAEAQDARSGPTTSGRAAAVQAYALLRLRRFGEAADRFERALRAHPSDWRLRRDLAQTLVLVGDRAGARAQMEHALALNPRMRVPPQFAAE